MGDSFFVQPASRKRRNQTSKDPGSRVKKSANHANANENAESGSEGSDSGMSGTEGNEEAYSSESEMEQETAAEKRRRLAKEYLSTLEEELVEGFDAKDLDEDIISRRLKQDAAESQGHIFRNCSNWTASKVSRTRSAARHLTALAASGTSVYVCSKAGRVEKYFVGKEDVGKCRLAASRDAVCGRKSELTCIAVDSSNKYIVVGSNHGFSVLNAENLQTLKEFKLNSTVLSMAFRINTLELYVGGTDLKLRSYDLEQFAFVETLHGHQDSIMSISALNQERCVSVGARDRTVIYWKIPEESRLTFRGGDTKLAAHLRMEQSQIDNQLNQLNQTDNQTTSDAADAADAAAADGSAATSKVDPRNVFLEGSIDCCAMLDNQMFVSGSDNGNISLWSTHKKKAQYIHALAHGKDDCLTPKQASGSANFSLAEIPPAVPRAVTALAAIPQSNMFVSGSHDGVLNFWCVSDDRREFRCTLTVEIGKGFVTGLTVAQTVSGKFIVCASLSREPRLGRWKTLSGHDTVASVELVPNESK